MPPLCLPPEQGIADLTTYLLRAVNLLALQRLAPPAAWPDWLAAGHPPPAVLDLRSKNPAGR